MDNCCSTRCVTSIKASIQQVVTVAMQQRLCPGPMPRREFMRIGMLALGGMTLPVELRLGIEGFHLAVAAGKENPHNILRLRRKKCGLPIGGAHACVVSARATPSRCSRLPSHLPSVRHGSEFAHVPLCLLSLIDRSNSNDVVE